MFNVGGGELMLIALVALLVLGPDKLPDFARKSARVLGQLRSMSQGFQNEMRGVMNFDDTDTPKLSQGPRLVGPIDTGNGPVSGEATTGSTTPETSPSESTDTSSPSAAGSSASDPATPSTDAGTDGNASGTSAA